MTALFSACKQAQATSCETSLLSYCNPPATAYKSGILGAAIPCLERVLLLSQATMEREDRRRRQAGRSSPSQSSTQRRRASSSTSSIREVRSRNVHPLSVSDPDVVRQLLCPMSVEQFLQECYVPQTPVVFRGSAERVKVMVEELHGCNVQSLLQDTPSESISVWVRDSSDGKIQTVRLDDPASAYTLYGGGHSTYCRLGPEATETALVASAARVLGLGFQRSPNVSDPRSHGEVELFCAKPGHVTAMHYDFQENFTLMLKGRKRWTLTPGVKHPIRGYSSQYKNSQTRLIDEVTEQQLKAHQLVQDSRENRSVNQSLVPSDTPSGEEAEVVLEEGDVLFHPSGWFHSVEALGSEDVVSINISLYGCTWADHITMALRQLLLRAPDFRALVATHSQVSPHRVVDDLLKRSVDALSSLTSAHLLPPCALWSQEHAHNDEAQADDRDDDDDDEEGDGQGRECMLDVATFQLEAPRYDPHGALTKSPLASLLPASAAGDEADGAQLFVANVMYGGEDLQSCVRRVLRVPPQAVAAALAIAALPSSSSFMLADLVGPPEQSAVLVDALLYLGVVVRRDRGQKRAFSPSLEG